MDRPPGGSIYERPSSVKKRVHGMNVQRVNSVRIAFHGWSMGCRLMITDSRAIQPIHDVG